MLKKEKEKRKKKTKCIFNLPFFSSFSEYWNPGRIFSLTEKIKIFGKIY